VELQNVMVWGPLSGRLGVSSSILSYNGRVTLGIISDANLIPDPDALVARLRRRIRQPARPHRQPLTNGDLIAYGTKIKD
jgi:hypothetical protein